MSNPGQLVFLARNVSKFCIGMEGNVSCRLHHINGFYIKASGASLSNMSTNDISCCDMTGRQLDKKKPSIEMEFHKIIYQTCPEINYIAHTHPINTLKILCGDKNLLIDFCSKRLYPEQVIFNGPESGIVHYLKPGKDLAIGIKNDIMYFIDYKKPIPKLILLQNHGIIALGKTVQECVAITETCEKAAEVFLGALSTGKIRYLSEESVTELLEDENEKYRMSLV